MSRNNGEARPGADLLDARTEERVLGSMLLERGLCEAGLRDLRGDAIVSGDLPHLVAALRAVLVETPAGAALDVIDLTDRFAAGADISATAAREQIANVAVIALSDAHFGEAISHLNRLAAQRAAARVVTQAFRAIEIGRDSAAAMAKARDALVGLSDGDGNEQHPCGPLVVNLDEVEPRSVQWLWPGRIPLGRITLLVGRPGEGKTFITLDMAARVSTGTPFPDGRSCPKGSVLLISVEDDPHDTIRPRLDAAHADVARIKLLNGVRFRGGNGELREAMFTLADIGALDAALAQMPECKLVVVDPIGSFLGGRTDAHRDNEVRSVLAPVARLAERYGCAVVVVAHRRKAFADSADDTALGSRAFTGIARAVWHISRDPENKGRRLMLPGKCNLSAEGAGLAFTIRGDPARLIWERDPVTLSADEGLAAEAAARRPGPAPEGRDAAAEWLRDALADGPVEVAHVRRAADSAGLAWRTVQRAAEELEVVRLKADFAAGWTWGLPAQDAKMPRCQVAPEAANLASWHLGENTLKMGISEARAAQDAKLHDLGILGANAPTGDASPDGTGADDPRPLAERYAGCPETDEVLEGAGERSEWCDA